MGVSQSGGVGVVGDRPMGLSPDAAPPQSLRDSSPRGGAA